MTLPPIEKPRRARTWFWPVLGAIVVVALGIRVAYVAAAKRGPCPVIVDGKVIATYPSACTVGDQIFYNAEANSVAQGDGFVEPLWAVTHPGEKAPPAADHPPLTVLVLTPVSWLGEHGPLAWVLGDSDELDAHVREHRYAMALLGSLVVLLVGLLGRRVSGDRVGVAAAAIAAVTPNLWVNDGLVMSETVTGVAVLGALLAAFAFRDRPVLGRALALGALCGVASLARAELILLVPLLLVPVALTARTDRADRAALTVTGLVGAALVIAPWVGFNLSRFEERTYLSTNDGIALLGSNCDVVYSGRAIGLTSIAGQRDCLDVPPPPGDQSQVAEVYRRRAFDYIEAHKRRFPLVVAARIGRTWSVYRPLDMVAFNKGEGREPWVTRLGLVAYYPTLIGAIAGAVVLFRRRRRMALWILLVPAVACTIGSAATYGQTRFRAAAEPSLAILAAIALVTAVETLHARRTRTPEPFELVTAQSPKQSETA